MHTSLVQRRGGPPEHYVRSMNRINNERVPIYSRAEHAKANLGHPSFPTQRSARTWSAPLWAEMLYTSW